MNNFEISSKEEAQSLLNRLRGLSLGEIVAQFGEPDRELGPHHVERVTWEGESEAIDYSRSLGFFGKGTNAHVLWVHKRLDGALEFLYSLDVNCDPYSV